MPANGDRWEWFQLDAINAATTETIYFPLGYPQGISTAATAGGPYREVLIKEVFAGGTDENIRLMEIGVFYRDGHSEVLSSLQNPASGVGVPTSVANQQHFGRGYALVVHCSNIRDVYVSIRNAHASNAKQYYVGIRYEAIQ